MLRASQWPLLTPVQHAQNNDNRGMIEVELGAAQQQQHYSASEAILIYNQQLHADQSANAIAGETSSSADGALTAGAAHIQSNCRPVRVSRAQKRVCSLVQPGVLGMRVAKTLLSLSPACMRQTYLWPTPRTRPAHGVRGNSYGM